MKASKMSQQGCLFPSLITRDRFSGLRWQRENANFLKSFSDLQVLRHVHKCADTNRENKYTNQSPKSQIKIVWIKSNYQILLEHRKGMFTEQYVVQ